MEIQYSNEEITLVEFCAHNIDCQRAECPLEASCVEGAEFCHSIPTKMTAGDRLSADDLKIIEFFFLLNDEKLWNKNRCIPKGTRAECPHSKECDERDGATDESICIGLLRKLERYTPDEYQILEREVQKVILNNLANIDWGFQEELRYYKHETQIDIGRPDILLEGAKTRTLYVVELKPSRAEREHVGQLQSYVGWYMEHLPSEFSSVRGILVAADFNSGAIYAIKANESLEARRYSLSVQISAP